MTKFKLYCQHLNLLSIIPFLIMCMLISSCFLERGGLAPTPTPAPPPRAGVPTGMEGVPDSWSASAFPGYACPADNITFEWNVGDPMCSTGTGPSCQTLSVSDNLLVLTPPFTSSDLMGSQSYGNISSITSWSGDNPRLTFSVAHDDASDPGWTDISSEVLIIQNPPTPPIAQTFTATSVCSPVSRRWSLVDFRLDMTSQSFIDATRGLGPCVRITSICYMPSSSGSVMYDPIIVSIVGGGAMAATTLARGECIDGLSLTPDLHYQVVPDSSVPILERMGGSCVEGTTTDPITPPPYIEIQFTLQCDTTLPVCGN